MRRGAPRSGLRRTATYPQSQARSQPYTFVPPVRGMVLNENITGPTPGGAAVLENFISKPTGIAVRGGHLRHATIGLLGLPYDGGTGAFLPGDIVTGSESNATATIVAIVGDATSGTLYVDDVDGTFADNEGLSDQSTGAADANIPNGITPRPPVESEVTYKFGGNEKLFAANNAAIYEVTAPADPYVSPAPDVDGQSSGDYSAIPSETVGGGFLYMLNGVDAPQLYNGSAWHPITDKETHGLAYDAEVSSFVVDATVTGGTSGATAKIVKVVDNGSTGILHVQDIAGTFQDNEAITGGGGSATSNIPTGVSDINLIKITGLSFPTSQLRQGCVYRNRIFFARANSLIVAYLNVESLGGAASVLNLSGVFNKGGQVEFVATWSLDAGDGLDDKIVFVTNQGEAAAYEGNFSSASEIRFIGRYDVAPPLGKNAYLSVGGDLVLITRSGWMPMSKVITTDPADLSKASMTRTIEPLWRAEVEARGTKPWQAIKLPERGYALCSLPKVSDNQAPKCLALGLETSGWSLFTGWDVRSLALFDAKIYFGTSDGRVMLSDVGGNDDGNLYVARAAGLAERIAGGALMTARMARAAFEFSTNFNLRISMSADYGYDFPSPPAAAMTDTSGAALWDSALWDVALWDQGLDAPKQRRSNWEVVNGVGYALAWQIQIACGDDVAPDIELQSVDLQYEVGAWVA